MAVLRCSACVRDISAREGGGVPCPLPRNKKLLWMRRPPPAEMSGLLVRAHASRAQSSHPQLPIYPSPLEVLCPAWRAVGKVGRRGCCTSPQNVRKPAPELTIASTYSRSISSVSSSRQSPRVGGGAAATAYAWVGGSTPALSRCWAVTNRRCLRWSNRNAVPPTRRFGPVLRSQCDCSRLPISTE